MVDWCPAASACSGNDWSTVGVPEACFDAVGAILQGVFLPSCRGQDFTADDVTTSCQAAVYPFLMGCSGFTGSTLTVS